MLFRSDDLSFVMREASICGLGQAAPNPMDCVRRYFAHEIAVPVSDGGHPGTEVHDTASGMHEAVLRLSESGGNRSTEDDLTFVSIEIFEGDGSAVGEIP